MKLKLDAFTVALIAAGGYLAYRAWQKRTPQPASSACPPGTAYASTYDAAREMYSGSCQPIGG